MASKLLDAISKERVIHSVGNINSGKVRTVNHGCVAKVDLENYSLVKLSFNAEGEREMDYISALTDETYLVCASEEMYVVGGVKDSFSDFYVGAGEKARVIHLEKGVRFEVSNFEADADVTPAKGHYAEWDTAKKKYVIKVDKPTADKILMVVEVEKASKLDGQKCIRLEVQ